MSMHAKKEGAAYDTYEIVVEVVASYEKWQLRGGWRKPILALGACGIAGKVANCCTLGSGFAAVPNR